MAKKVYPAWQYFLAGCMALLVGFSMAAYSGLPSGLVFLLVGLGLVVWGFVKLAKGTPHAEPTQP